jgi:hypothetical protein
MPLKKRMKFQEYTHIRNEERIERNALPVHIEQLILNYVAIEVSRKGRG